MKRLLFFVLIMSVCVAVEAQSGYKTCPSCRGTGHPFAHSEMVCSRCGGTGKIARSASEMQREARENERYANSANDLMQQFNLSPQEFFAYEELIKESMKQVPVYQTCTACGGTGKCKQCGGYMNVSLDGPLCRICGGSGQCLGCKGLGQIQIGMQENPNKEQLIQRANEILHSHETSPSPTPAPSYDGGVSGGAGSTGISSGGDGVEGGLDPMEARSESGSRAPILLFFMGVCAAGVLGVLGFLGFRLLRK